MTTFTPQELAAAAASQACVNRLLELSDIPEMMDEAGYPAGPEYAERAAAFRAVELETVTALGFSLAQALDIRWRIAFKFQGTRIERVAVMGEYWVKNQEDRGIVPCT